MAAHPRLGPPARPGWLARFAMSVSKRQFGRVLGPLTVLAHHRGVLFANLAFETATQKAKHIPKPLKSLAQIETARLVGCPF